MYTSKYFPCVEINCPPGLYVFDDYSAMGKSYLCRLLREHRSFGEPVYGYSYDSYLDNISLDDLITCGKFKVIAVDRYDMYYGTALDTMRANTSSIILLDTKWPAYKFSVPAAYIDFDVQGVRVTCD